MRYFLGVLESSVRYQPLISTLVPGGLYNSTESISGGSVWMSSSLMTMGGMSRPGSSAPGYPPALVLAPQLAPLSGACEGPGCFGTSENPCPSGVTGQGA